MSDLMQRKYEAVFNQAAVGIARVGIDGRWLEVNDKVCSIVGYTREEMMIRTFQDITHPDDLHADLELVQKVLAGEIQTYSMRKRYIRKDSSLVWINLTVSLVRDEKQEPVFFVSVIDDISQLVDTESELSEKTRDLERSNRELEEFAYVSSHDLKEPLRGIAGMLQVLQNKYASELTPSAQKLLNDAIGSANRLKNMITDLLEYSRVGRNRISEVVDLDAVVSMALNNLDSLVSESGAEFTVARLPKVIGDENLLVRLFQNLFANSIKFCREAPLIDVKALRKNDHCQIVVTDNGIGISPEAIDRVFKIFYRDRKTDSPGTGIGLAVCKRVVEYHGGEIWVESSPGAGARFYFTLKLAVKQANQRSS